MIAPYRATWFEVDGPAGLDIVPMELVHGAFGEIEDRTPPVSVPRALSRHCRNTLCWTVKKRQGFLCKGDTGPMAGFKRIEDAHAYLDAQPDPLQ